MSWSFKIGTIFGIPIRIHLTFLLLLGYIALKPEEGLSGAGFVGLIFICVVLHELGHSLVGRKFGADVASITLLPIGGVASMRNLPKSAKAEMFTAIAGPAVSVALGVIFLFLYKNMSKDFSLLLDLGGVNLFLAAFNLIPAFPMDGGRVLRAALWSRKGYSRATMIASKIGQVLAVACFILALTTSNFMLGLIALFIFFGADTEKKAAVWNDAVESIPAWKAMQTNLKTLGSHQTIRDAFFLMKQSGQENFPVVGENGLLGILTRIDLLRAIRDNRLDLPAADFMTKELVYCKHTDNLADIIHLMDHKNLPCVIVMDQESIVGLITPEMLQKVVVC